MSKYTFKISDIYYPDISIPKNKLNIKNEEELRKIEHLLLLEAYDRFAKKFDVELNEEFFISVHKNTFQDLYEWAGVYKNIEVIKSNTLFYKGMYIKQEMEKLFDKLKKIII